MEGRGGGGDTDTFSTTDTAVSIQLNMLSLGTEAVDCSKFNYSQTWDGHPGRHSGDTNPTLIRILERSSRACGLLVYSESMTKLQKPTLQFVLMGEPQ